MQAYINTRAIGQLPISLPTSSAIETVLGVSEFNRDTLIRDKKEIWINIATLVRNLYSSLDKDTQAQVSDNELANTVIDEMEIIESSIKDKASYLKVNFYYVYYNRIMELYPNASFRTLNTEKQRFKSILLDNACSNIKQVDTDNKIKIFNLDIKPLITIKAVILTHSPMDLTSDIYFSDLVLLESHTGKVKTKQDWYTKLVASDKNPLLPFNRDTLAIFGDSEVFKPQPVRYRRIMIDTAEKYKWSIITTKDRIKLTLGFHPEKLLVQELLKILNK